MKYLDDAFVVEFLISDNIYGGKSHAWQKEYIDFCLFVSKKEFVRKEVVLALVIMIVVCIFGQRNNVHLIPNNSPINTELCRYSISNFDL